MSQLKDPKDFSVGTTSAEYVSVPAGYTTDPSYTPYTQTGGTTIPTHTSISYPATGAGNVTWPSNSWYTPTPFIKSYSVLELPESKMPLKVFIDGGLMTTGVVGSKAQVAYDGRKKLIIKANAITWDEDSITYMSIEYKKSLYHYAIYANESFYKEDSVILDAQLLSKVKL